MADPRLLVVDDEVEIGRFVGEVAEACGFEVARAVDVAEFEHALAHFKPSAIVLDLSLQDTDGIELLHRLATLHASASIVLLSGFDARVLRTALRVGRELGLRMVDALQKPIPLNQLEHVLKKLQRRDPKISAHDLHGALDRRELYLEFQPKISLSTNELWGFEALLRWSHPERGLIAPGQFVVRFEEEGLAGPMTDEALRLAAEQVVAWDASGSPFRVAVNLSPAVVVDASLPDRIADQLAAAGVRRGLISFEVTESGAMSDVVRASDVLARLRIKGFDLALDDFGTGYSSLVWLHRLPFGELKIDRSFVMELEENEEARMIVRSTIELAHNLGLEVCAEGIETEGSRRQLLALGCERAQGYLFSRPLIAERVPEWVRGWQAQPQSLAADVRTRVERNPIMPIPSGPGTPPTPPSHGRAPARGAAGREPDFRALFESSPGCFLILEPDTSRFTIVAVSDAYLRATMAVREEILGCGLFEVFPDNPKDPVATGTANLRESLERVLAHRIPDTMAVQKYDIRRPDAEGGGFEERYWSPVNSPVFGEDGRTIEYIVHRVEDVTDFVRLKLAGSEQQRITEALKTRAGSMETEIYRRAQQIQDANRRLRQLQAGLEERVTTQTADLRRANTDLQREIEERERAEQALRHSEDQLRQSQKLEAIGRLAGGVAHDFNNLLTVILGRSEFMGMKLDANDSMHQSIAEIQKAALRAASLTRQLLAFSRQQVLQPKVLDLNGVIVDVDKMLQRLIGEDIDLLTVPASDLGRVKADPGQIEQVLMNLAVNARDAMPGGGKLTIETANVTLDELLVQGRGLAAGPHVMLAVSDSGVGMDAETQARIFEPFFTTKEVGRGTGLGLSTVHGIVKQSGGHIEVYSEPGRGSTFKVYLPRVEEPLERAAPDRNLASGLRGTEVILVLEDEEMVRHTVTQALRMYGYVALDAASRGEALEVCRARQRNQEPLDLVLSDVVMPGMSVEEFADQLRLTHPDTRILYMSGYTDRAMFHQGVLAPDVAFVQKPLSSEQLLTKIREILGEPRARRGRI
jgi:EAL domain-containing protein (putative c-di-GMP-specific phosphodiesterase class I)/signal transduction histidine kinase/FixJ family two-component response regulator